MVSTSAERHRHAAKAHAAAAERHAQAVVFWLERGDTVRADLERRNEVIERAAASLELDRADLEDREAVTNC